MNIGIIGLGFMGATHLAACQKLPNVRVKAVSARSARARSGDFSEASGNLGRPLPPIDLADVAKYEDWRQLVADPLLDAVDICLPTDLHEEVSLAAFRSGKHVLCEKPMALTGSQCEAMLSGSQDADRILMIGHVLRFWPDYMRLQDFVRSGGHGSVRTAIFTRQCGLPDWSSWLPDSARSGGAVLDLLIHDIDQVIALFGPPNAVRAKAFTSGDTLMATLLYEGGPEVRIQGGWLTPGAPFSMTFQVRADRAQLELTPAALLLTDEKGQSTTVGEPADDPYVAQLAYFAECCLYNRQPERCLPQESAAAVKLAECLRQSRTLDGEQVKCVL